MMKKNKILILALCGIVLAIGLVAVACKKDEPTNDTDDPKTEAVSTDTESDTPSDITSNPEQTSSDTDGDEEESETEKDPNNISYAEYIKMSSDEQRAHMDSFDSLDDFLKWYNAAKAEHDAAAEDSRTEVDSSDITIDLGGNSGNGGSN